MAVMTAANAYRREEIFCVTVALLAGVTHGSAPASARAGDRVVASSGRCPASRDGGALIGAQSALARPSSSAAGPRRDNSAQRLCRAEGLQPRPLLSHSFLNHSKFTIG